MLREACSVCRLVIADAPLPSLRRLGIYAQLLALLTDPQTREKLDETRRAIAILRAPLSSELILD